MIDSIGTSALEIFGWMNNSISENTKTQFKSTGKALAFGAACLVVIKTLSYLSNAKPSDSYDWKPIDSDDDSESCCSKVDDRETITTPDTEPSNNVVTVADKVTSTVAETFSEPKTEETTPVAAVEREEKSWLDRFEEAECATGTNPWSVPPTSSFEVYNESSDFSDWSVTPSK